MENNSHGSSVDARALQLLSNVVCPRNATLVNCWSGDLGVGIVELALLCRVRISPGYRPCVWRSLLGLGVAALVAGCDGTPTAVASGDPVETVTPVATVTVNVPAQASPMLVGTTRQFTAIARDVGGRELMGRMVQWSSTAVTIASVSNDGVVTALVAGTTTIRASIDGVLGSTSLTVLARVARVAVSPLEPTATVGTTLKFDAIPYDADENPLTGRAIAWSSSAPGVAEVIEGDGTVRAVAVGQATIAATVEGVVGSVELSVIPVPVASVSVSPQAATVMVGTTQQLTVVARDSSGAPLVNRPIGWESSNPLVATVSPGGLVGAHSEGEATITATIGGVAGTARIGVLAPTTLQAWLAQRPRLAQAIVWQDASGTTSYPNWPASRKAELDQAFIGAMLGQASVPDIPPNLVASLIADDDGPWTVLSAAAARGLYIATVAHSLAVEYARKVAWSLLEYSDPDLASLLDGRSFFSWTADWHGSGIAGYEVIGWVLPSPPDIQSQFLVSRDLIRGNRVATVARVIDWARDRMVHFTGFYTMRGAEAHWQYRGLAPVSRIFGETANALHPFNAVRAWTPGCHGTSYFLRALLRAVNIPVNYVLAGSHATPYLSADGLYFSHGDDPYNALMRWSGIGGPPIPSAEVFITPSTWMSWFGPAVTAQARANNIGRRILELSLSYLPHYLLWRRCEDIQAGLAKGSSSVFFPFSGVYSVAELDAQTLWERLDSKIASLGGCSSIPAM
jgi:uncharacterized protein YjdB